MYGSAYMAGVVGCASEFDHFSLAVSMTSKANQTTCYGGWQDYIDTLRQAVVTEVAVGGMTPRIGRVYRLADIFAAHRCIEDNVASVRIVILA